jgi:hypothetical protein
MSHEQVEARQEWLQKSTEQELPRRPRRRLPGPAPLALLGVLLLSCGFIGGVLVEKGQISSSAASSSGAPASRLASLRSAAVGGTSFSRDAPGGTGTGAPAGTPGPVGGRSATVGQVAYVSGHTLYVSDFEGNTIKVGTSAASSVTKTVKATVKDIKPGETIVVTGSAGANGAVSAESVRASEADGDLGTLFGGGGRLRGGGSSGSASGGGGVGSGSNSEPTLFGR